MDSPTEHLLDASTQTAEFSVKGMTCGSCVAIIENVLSSNDGIVNVNVNLVTEKATVEFHSPITVEYILEEINSV